MKRVSLVVYLLILHVVIAAVLIGSDFLLSVGGRLGLTDPNAPAVHRMQDVLVSRVDPSVPAHASVFLGDSITHGLATAAVAPISVNFGISGQTAAQLANSIDRFASVKRASRVYLLIGTNDITLKQASELPASFKRIIAAIPANVPIIWSAIMPRAALAEIAREVNKQAAATCADRPGCVFLDTEKSLSDPSFYSDGLHLNATGYTVWISELKRHTAL